MGAVIFLIIFIFLKLLAEGSLDFIYVIIIGLLAIAYPILCYIMLFSYNPQDSLVMVTIVELTGIIFLSSKFILTHDAKRVRKTIGYIINIASVCCILAIIIRLLMIIH